MATGISLSSTSGLTNGQRIVIASAKEAFEPAAPDPDLIENERIPTGVKQWDISTYARLTDAQALTEGVDLSSVQQLATNTLQLTPAEHGILVTLSNRLIRRQGDSSVITVAGRQIGASLRRRMAKDVISLYGEFTKQVVGTGAAMEMIQRWWRGSDRLYGIPIFHSGNIERDSSNDAKGAIFASGALYMVIANDADVTEENDNSLRASEYGIFQEWAEGERADPHGVTVYSNATATV